MQIIETNFIFKNTLTKRKSTNKFIIHHAAAKSASVEQIHQWHLGNGWSGIGYHFYVCKDGKVYRGRPIDAIGSHCTGNNSDSIGICFEGNYDFEMMPNEQWKSGIELLHYLGEKYPTVKVINGHKAYKATACPGKYFPLSEMVSAASLRDFIVSNGIEKPNTKVNQNVLLFQKAANADGYKDKDGKKLIEDGIAGSKTEYVAGKIALRKGSKGELVKWVQKNCNELIVLENDLVIDGDYGNLTFSAVQQYQKYYGLSNDGVAGIDTLFSMMIE